MGTADTTKRTVTLKIKRTGTTPQKSWTCGECGVTLARDDCVVVRKEWRKGGSGGRALKIRTLRYLCEACCEYDDDFALPELEKFTRRTLSEVSL